jgi:hypothetical protein
MFRVIRLILVLVSMANASSIAAQQRFKVKLSALKAEKRVLVTVGELLFTEFFYPDSLEKPVLFPIHAPDGQVVTRGFPVKPRIDDPTDHPHHVGLWFNYENVNGLDFWNNSYAIAPDKKKDYGWIRTDSILSLESGDPGKLTYIAYWKNKDGEMLLKETTQFIFTAYRDIWSIDRICHLEALQDTQFPDAKDGCLGLRVSHALELPSAQTQTYTDLKGNKTSVKGNNMEASGNYLTSEGKQGDSAWGTKAVWCMLYGKMGLDSVSVAIIDHPMNPGYPTYWHARGYGLFAANPLGRKIFSQGKEELDFKLQKGASAVFRYRIMVASGKTRMDPVVIDRMAAAFAKIN